MDSVRYRRCPVFTRFFQLQRSVHRLEVRRLPAGDDQQPSVQHDATCQPPRARLHVLRPGRLARFRERRSTWGCATSSRAPSRYPGPHDFARPDGVSRGPRDPGRGSAADRGPIGPWCRPTRTTGHRVSAWPTSPRPRWTMRGAAGLFYGMPRGAVPAVHLLNNWPQTREVTVQSTATQSAGQLADGIDQALLGSARRCRPTWRGASGAAISRRPRLPNGTSACSGSWVDRGW